MIDALQATATKTVNRFKFFSTTVDPDRDALAAPPNIEERPPPRPRCKRMRTINRRLVMTSTIVRRSFTGAQGSQ